MKNAAVVEAVSGLPADTARALEPILQRISHDLNGAMTPLTLEASTLGDLVQRLDGAAGDVLPATLDAGEIRETLAEASTHLRMTADRVSRYLADVRHALERRKGIS